MSAVGCGEHIGVVDVGQVAAGLVCGCHGLERLQRVLSSRWDWAWTGLKNFSQVSGSVALGSVALSMVVLPRVRDRVVQDRGRVDVGCRAGLGQRLACAVGSHERYLGRAGVAGGIPSVIDDVDAVDHDAYRSAGPARADVARVGVSPTLGADTGYRPEGVAGIVDGAGRPWHERVRRAPVRDRPEAGARGGVSRCQEHQCGCEDG